MNQRQRDYLVKRLQKIAEVKKASFKVEKPNIQPFIKKLKLKSSSQIMAIEKIAKLAKAKECSYSNSINNGSECLQTKDFFTNFDEINKQVEEFQEKHYSIVTKRRKSIDDKCEEYCDKIILAESYEEALAVLREFGKF